MAILTDGPAMESADKWNPATIAQLEAVHQHQVLIHAIYGLTALVVLLAVWIIAPRLWRRARAALAGSVRMPDPARPD